MYWKGVIVAIFQCLVGLDGDFVQQSTGNEPWPFHRFRHDQIVTWQTHEQLVLVDGLLRFLKQNVQIHTEDKACGEEEKNV